MSQPFEIFESQNLDDDDGPVIDSLLIETDSPPPIKDAIEPITVVVLEKPKKTTRLITGDMTIQPDWPPVSLLTADANRLGVNVKVYSTVTPTPTATDGVRFSDERGNVLTSGKILHGGSTTFDNHTGPIWVIACGNATDGKASAPVSLEYWSVTE